MLEGLLRCLNCDRTMQPAPAVDGRRFYGCAPGCDRPTVEAPPIERQALLGGYLRGCVVLHGMGRTVVSRHPVADANGGPVSASELARWRLCDVTNPRAVVRAAYVRVEVDEQGEVRPIPHPAGDL